MLSIARSSQTRRCPVLASVLLATALVTSCGGGATPAGSSAPASSSAKPAPASSSSAASASVSGSVAAAPGASTSASASGPAKLTGTPIKIGVLDDVTGQTAIEGAEMRISTEMAVQDINSTGGINGHPVEAVYVDPKGDAAEALQLATKLAQQDKVDVLAGGVNSAECLGVSHLAPQLGIVYLATLACQAEPLTSQNCNKFSFRFFPVGRQTMGPAVGYEVRTFGKKWAVIAPQSPLGDSIIGALEATLKAAGATLPLKIEMPIGEANVTPYVTKIPTDGSINVVFNAETGTDLARIVAVMQQFGISSKVHQILALGKENYGGVYPDAANGAIISGVRPGDPLPNSKDDQAYFQAFADTVAKDSQLAGVLGGPKAVPGLNGYEGYVSLMALKLAMRSSGFTGRADTDKLIAALENITIPQGPDAPAGVVTMDKKDHQGVMPLYLRKINGQKEEMIQTIPADQLPPVGNCDVNAKK